MNRSIFLCFIIIYLLCSEKLTGQIWQNQVLQGREVSPTQTQIMSAKARSGPVALPFFDDFSILTSGLPDTSLWMPKSGAFVNNTFADNPPSVGTATFDGLSASGLPYSSNQFATGPSDTLCSRPLDLLNKPNVYLSFFWQAGGVSAILEPGPGASDSLVLQFKTSANTWRTVWRRVSPQQTAPFAQINLHISQPSYLHPDFQFRFINYGRLWGNFDLWHIDYLYLNANRSANDIFYNDIALISQPTALLGQYRAMPYKQLAASNFTVSQPVIQTGLRNFTPNIAPFSVNFDITDRLSGQNLLAVSSGESNIEGSGNPAAPFPIPRVLRLRPALLNLNVINAPMIVKTRFFISQSAASNQIAANDTVSQTSYITNFFALDDGTPELMSRLHGNGVQAVFRYELSTTDTLCGLSLYLPRSFQTLSPQSVIRVILWYSLKNIDGSTKDSIIFKNPFTLNYAGSTGFQTLSLVHLPVSQRIISSGKLYVGWENANANGQETSVAIGKDLNTSSIANFWYRPTNNATWQPEILPEGNAMIRPVFGSPQMILKNKNAQSLVSQIEIYPNPSSENIHIDAIGAVQAQVYTMQGQQIYTSNLVGGSADFYVGNWAKGIYIVKIKYPNQRIQVRKIVVL